MNSKARNRKILVIVGPGLLEAAAPMESVLLRRAAMLARATGYEIELFHAAFDSALEYQLFKSKDEIDKRRQMLLDKDATRLAEIAAWLVEDGLKVDHEVRWDYPRTDALLRKIAHAKPEFVLKQLDEHGFLLGITTNTDWELARRSTSDVWLVHEESGGIDPILAAIGNRSGESSDVASATDQRLLETAVQIGKACEARVLAVNAYELPDVSNFVANVGGTVMPVQSAKEQQETRKKILASHEQYVKRLAEEFRIGESDLYVREGHPGSVIPEVAEQANAGLIVMGANSISRLERMVRPVTVEPVMAEADCDILVIREDQPDTAVAVKDKPRTGVPRHDLEHAITHPDETFESPQQVANLSDVSIDLRKRILQAWEYDIRAEMAEENEGGPVKPIDVNALDDILSAKELLEMKAREAAENEANKTRSAG